MKLVWTYNGNVVFGNEMGLNTPERKIILINYYIHSIQVANQLGYHTVIYCDESSSIHFKNIANEIIVVNSYENSLLWDSFKIKVLEERTDEFCLIDGDVILHNKLPEFTSDITFDSYEINNFKKNYQNVINTLTDLGISNVVDMWDNKRIPIISCGVLNISNSLLKDMYVFNWKKYNRFVLDNIIDIDIDLLTMVGAQYLLSIVSDKFTHTKLSSLVGVDNEYYTHYCGPGKYNNPIVPSDYLIYELKKQLF